MKYSNLYKQLRNENFSEIASISAIQILTINITMEIKVKDMKESGRFTNRLKKKSRNILWEITDDEFEISWKLYECFHEFEISNSLYGLGGCVRKTFTELMKEK